MKLSCKMLLLLLTLAGKPSSCFPFNDTQMNLPLSAGAEPPKPGQNQDLIISSGSGGDNPDDEFKPPFPGQRVIYYSYWVIPVIRYLITVQDDSALMGQNPVEYMLPVVLPLLAGWWNSEKSVTEYVIEHNDTPMGDPVFLFEQPMDMDGREGERSERTDNSGSDNTGNNDAPEKNEQDQEEDRKADENNHSNDPPSPDDTNTSDEHTQVTEHNLQRMLIEKIEAQDGVSVFCLLFYCKVDPNTTYQGREPLLVAVQTGNKEIIDLLYEFGARPNDMPYCASLCDLSQSGLRSIAMFFTSVSRYTGISKNRESGLTQLLINTIGSPHENAVVWLKAILASGVSLNFFMPVRALDGFYKDTFLLNVLLSHRWDGHPDIREQVFIRIAKSGVELCSIRFKRAGDRYHRFIRCLVQLRRKKDGDNRIITDELCFGCHISASGLLHLLQHVTSSPFTLDTYSRLRATALTSYYTRTFNNQFEVLMSFGQQRYIGEGVYFALLFSEFIESLYDSDEVEDIRIETLELAQQQNINLNSLMIGNMAFFEFICRHPRDYSKKNLMQLILSGLVPVIQDKWAQHLDYKDYLIQFVIYIQEQCKEHKHLSYQCFAVIDMTNKDTANRLPSNIFLRRFRGIVELAEDWIPAHAHPEDSEDEMEELIELCSEENEYDD